MVPSTSVDSNQKLTGKKEKDFSCRAIAREPKQEGERMWVSKSAGVWNV